MFLPRTVLAVWLLLASAASVLAQAPVEYRLTFPEPEHRWMQVEITFREVPDGPLQIRMSRSSPGRYALHEFAKNVFDVHIRDGQGRALHAARPNLHQWDVTGHDGTVVVTYRVFGDRVDGTYLGLDATHAHLNIPAALMWARGFEDRPAEVRLEQPPGRAWRVATQLFPTAEPLTFSAPNLQYLLDSPTEFSAHTVRTFSVTDAAGNSPTFHIALHHDGSDADADAFAADTERIVREMLAVFGEFPRFDTGTYTFIADYLPWANGDGMEHRNSTVLTSSGALRNPGQRRGLLGTVAHEFFHAWNIERIRPRDLEPFDFEEADVSDALWFGEGFTSYYDDLVLCRTGLVPLEPTLASFAAAINAVTFDAGRQFRTPVEMSRLAPFVDAAATIDRTYWTNTFISYYTYGAALGLALDLSLRDRSDGRITLDTYMRAMWERFGRPGQVTPGLVATPYTIEDLRAVLGEVSGDPAFAEAFFSRYIHGREVPDYATLLERAGLVLRPRSPGRAFLGNVPFAFQGGGARVMNATPLDSPLYRAGIDRDDLIVSIDGTAVASEQALGQVLGRLKPGSEVPVHFVRRSGETVKTTITVVEDPRLEIVPVERAGGQLTPAQERFRTDWLTSRIPAERR